MDEMKTILNAILNNQETTNSKLEALTMDIRKMQGDIAGIKGDITGMQGDIAGMQGEISEIKVNLDAFRNETNYNFRKFGRHMDAIESNLDKTINRVEF